MKDLASARREIDAIDGELVRLFQRRLEVVATVAESKQANGAPISDPTREAAILSRVAAEVEPEFAEGARRFFTTLFDISKRRQYLLVGGGDAAGRTAGAPPRIRTVAVAGLGLIGVSLLKAAERAGFGTVALHHGESAGLGRADLVFVALPVGAIAPWIGAHSAEFKPGAVVVDVGGVKRPVVEAVRRLPPGDWTFVGGHPMAGKERSGAENASVDLFCRAPMIITPDAGTKPETVAELKRVFESLGFGATVVTTPERHDRIIAFTSQLGHVVASAYAQDELVAEAVGFSAGSYADMTRIATMDADGWAALFLADRDFLLAALDRLAGRLGEFRAALAAADRERLAGFVRRGAEAKERELAARRGGFPG